MQSFSDTRRAAHELPPSLRKYPSRKRNLLAAAAAGIGVALLIAVAIPLTAVAFGVVFGWLGMVVLGAVGVNVGYLPAVVLAATFHVGVGLSRTITSR